MTKQELLNEAIEAAKKIAAEAGENCYIIESAIFARSENEYGENIHVVGTRGACEIMYMPLITRGGDSIGKLVGVVDTNGEPFLNQFEDIFARLKS